MSWLALVKRDAVPWLLDPENPSARYLALRDILKKSHEILAKEQQRILAWQPMQALFRQWNRFNFWGRVYDPYFGGQVGNFGTLYLLAQLGVPLTPELEPVCDNLLDVGRRDDGSFSPGKVPSAPWVCYTGMALKSLWHFGYNDDPRARSALSALLHVVLLRPELLDCPMAGGRCVSGLIKVLDALLSLPQVQRSADEETAIEALSEIVVLHPYDWSGRDSDLLRPCFPRYYDTDLLELCHVLAQTSYHAHYRFEELVQRLLALQNDRGRWIKTRATPALAVERINQPSRWLTFEAIHTLMLVYGDTMYAS